PILLVSLATENRVTAPVKDITLNIKPISIGDRLKPDDISGIIGLSEARNNAKTVTGMRIAMGLRLFEFLHPISCALYQASRSQGKMTSSIVVPLLPIKGWWNF